VRFIKWFLGIVVGLFALVLLVGVLSPRTSQQAKQQQSGQAVVATMKVDAGELARAYEVNSVAADQRFKGVRFNVTGTVVDIATDILGDTYVTLDGGVNMFMQPQFGFSKSDAAMVSGLRRGDAVTFACRGKGDVAKIPMSGDCTRL
jgi:tRNA_anti-like